MEISPAEKQFIAQSETFIELVVRQLGFERLEQVPIYSFQSPKVVEPLVIEDYKRVTETQKTNISGAYYSALGLAYLIIQNPDEPPTASHPLFDLAEQLKMFIPLGKP
jgi:hypothetical protein